MLVVWLLSSQKSWQPSDQAARLALSDFSAFPPYVPPSQRHGGLSLVPADVEVFFSPHSLFQGFVRSSEEPTIAMHEAVLGIRREVRVYSRGIVNPWVRLSIQNTLLVRDSIQEVVPNICDRVWEKGIFCAKIEFLVSGTHG